MNLRQQIVNKKVPISFGEKGKHVLLSPDSEMGKKKPREKSPHAFLVAVGPHHRGAARKSKVA